MWLGRNLHAQWYTRGHVFVETMILRVYSRGISFVALGRCVFVAIRA